MMQMKKFVPAVVAWCASSASIAGCASTMTEGPEGVGSTVAIHGDYPVYQIGELDDRATQIVEGTIVSSSSTLIYPEFEGDDPLLNPMAGASAEEIEKARKEGAIPATELLVRITKVHKGLSVVGIELPIVQTGGTASGVAYIDENAPILTEGRDYLLFLSDGEKPYVLGGGAGAYEATDEEFVATSDQAPVERITSEELNQIISGEGLSGE